MINDYNISIPGLSAAELDELFISCGINAKSRNANRDLWTNTLRKADYIPVAYTNMNIDFLFELQNGNGISIYDLSVIILWDHKPVAIWPLFLSVQNSSYILNCLDNKVLPPLVIADIATASVKKLIKNCLDFMNRLSKILAIQTWTSMESFHGNNALSMWHIQSLGYDAKTDMEYELFVDLSKDLSYIKGHFRKSYKSLISSAKTLWEVGVIDNTVSAVIWNEFKALHKKVSGRQTRSDKTWQIHYDDIVSGHSFLVYLRDAAGEMIGAGLFNTTENEGLYASGAYDRSLFDKPVGHIVQYTAIEILKKRGIQWYKLGPRLYSTQVPVPSEKEITISEFKQGFASHMFPRFIIKHPGTEKRV